MVSPKASWAGAYIVVHPAIAAPPRSLIELLEIMTTSFASSSLQIIIWLVVRNHGILSLSIHLGMSPSQVTHELKLRNATSIHDGASAQVPDGATH